SLRENEAPASFPREETRHRLILPLEDEATPRSPLEDEAAPRSPTGRRGDASFPARRRGGTSLPHWKTRQCLIPARGDEASPRFLVSAREDEKSFSSWEGRRTVPHATGQYRSKRRTLDITQ
ncbi:hypothetical protein BHM03_00053501, partial [Ensete ventricosum]